ncbi:YbaY family lipoprotein [Pseudomonas sp. O230]|uniref:YbaY family lipoprotein n=1 Tax=Pseudomonas sp. O230 TaxID=3159450 RepID=UPI00387B42BC
MNNDYEKSISGTVHFLLRIELPTHSTLYVNLLDVTCADAPAKELARQVIPHAKTTGLDFTLRYKMADVLPDHRYAIRARIETSEQVIFATTKDHTVQLGVDHLRPEDVIVRNVRTKPDSNF